MAKVHFYPAKLAWKSFIDTYFTPIPTIPDFSFLVFQLEIEDGNRKIDDYILTAYIVKSDWSVVKKISSQILTPDYASNSHNPTGKIYFANYPLSRNTIDDFISDDPTGDKIECLYFKPLEYPSQPKYTYYQIFPIYKDEPLISGELKSKAGENYLQPSPPANAI